MSDSRRVTRETKVRRAIEHLVKAQRARRERAERARRDHHERVRRAIEAA